VALGLVLALVVTTPAFAQWSGSNLLLAQLGNWPPSLPDRGTPDRESFYDRLDLQWQSGSLLAGLRFETDRNSDEQYEYEGVTRRYVDWRDDQLHLRVGHVTTILGRGLVHRSFEIPGVVLEETGFRTRYTPVRDVDGVLAEFDRGPLSLRALSGAPSEGSVSLARERLLGTPRHRGHVAGGQAAWRLPRQARVGASVLRTGGGTDPSSGLPRQHAVGSGFLELDPMHLAGVGAVALPLYVEYAQEDRTFGDWWAFERGDLAPHALYSSANLLWGPVTLSLEWKDYAGFLLGVNDPPSLVREHTSTLLNRRTHVLVAQREEGYQAELAWTPRPAATLVFNRSRADGARGDRFEEVFAEFRLTPAGGVRWEGSVFADRATDSTQSILRRDTYGGAATYRWGDRWAVSGALERQTAARVGFDLATLSIARIPFEDVHTSLSVSLADVGSLGVSWDRTTDPLDPSWEPGRARALHLVGWTAGARVGAGHEATLFVGRRRGGLACTAGTCYQVQPFEGAELRLTSRF